MIPRSTQHPERGVTTSLPAQSDPRANLEARVGVWLAECRLPAIIRPKLPTGAPQVVSAPSRDLGQAPGSAQLQPILPAAAWPLEIVQVSRIKCINSKLTICACFTTRLQGKVVRKKNLICREGLALLDPGGLHILPLK